jgi:predicted amidohydrolase
LTSIKIAAANFPGARDLGRNLDAHLSAIEDAATKGAQLLVFPELSLHGIPRPAGVASGKERYQVFENAQNVTSGPATRELRKAAAEHNLTVIYGLVEHGEEIGDYFNSAVVIGPKGDIGTYRKNRLFYQERAYYRPGTEYRCFDTKVGRLAPMICLDKLSPEPSQAGRALGAEILIYLTGSPGMGTGLRQHVSAMQPMYDQVRAIETTRWVVSANYASLDDESWAGQSRIVDPLGHIIAQAGTDPGLLVADIDPAHGIKQAIAVMGQN